MNTHELNELIASADLVAYAKKLAQQYTNPDDVEAATKALLLVSLEQIFNRRISIEQISR
jgi:hypothetical protein